MKALNTEDVFSEDNDFYPCSDGKPMADNTKQYEWIVRIKEGLEVLFADDPDVFVAADLLWYPTEGDRHTRAAPDVMVALGRPKGHRGSYLQWREGGIAPQVVFEILSPGNRAGEMRRKLAFYERHGAEEYYVYDPNRKLFEVRMRLENRLRSVENTREWTSPRLRIRFEFAENLSIFRPNGEKFLSFLETDHHRQSERERAERAELKIVQERKQAELKIVQERERAEQERKRAEQERKRAEHLAAKFRELGIDPENL